VTHLLLAALARKRTADPAYLTCLAEDALVTIGLRTDPEHDKALAQAAKEPAGPAAASMSRRYCGNVAREDRANRQKAPP
jgi:hypothetical protein